MPKETQCAWCKRIRNAKTNKWENRGAVEYDNKTCCNECQDREQQRFKKEERQYDYK